MDALNVKIDAVNALLQQLENAFQKREKEVVIEFAIDRILHYIGVYLILILVVLSKVSQLIDDNIVCYPTNASKTNLAFMAYSTTYCWEQGKTNFTSNTTEQQRSDMLIDNAKDVVTLTCWMPYLFLAEAIMFAIPSLWWHAMVGARLMGHVQFLLSFLKDVYESLHKIPAGVYRRLPYDQQGTYLDGWRSFEQDYKSREQQGQTSTNRKRSANEQESGPDLPEVFKTEAKKLTLSTVLKEIVGADLREFDDPFEDENKSEEPTKSSTLTGDMKDRHLFSMLCYENLASLDIHPYIMSVYGLTSTAAANGDRRGIVSLKQGILRQFFHEKNFTGNFLVMCYVIRYIISMLLSFLLMVACLVTFLSIEYQTFGTKAFLCDIPMHGHQMVCTMRGHWDIIALLLVNLCILLGYFLMSVFQFYFVRFGSHRAVCHYFEDMSDNFSVALGSAHLAEKNE